MDDLTLDAHPVWVTEPYWPGVAEELVLAQAQRLGQVPGWMATNVMPAEQTAFRLYAAPRADVRRALTRVDARAATINPGLRVSPSETRSEHTGAP